jgi:hypothetical protein
VTLAVDTLAEPIAGKFIDDPAIQIIDFTGSPRYGAHLERHRHRQVVCSPKQRA